MRNVKMVSHPENTTVHKLLDARSHKGCIVAGSNPVLTTLIKLVYEKPLRWDALIRKEVRWLNGKARPFKSEYVGSIPVLTTRFGSSPNSMSNTMRSRVIPCMELLIGKRSIRFD